MKETTRIAEICIEIDKRIVDVGLAFARVEFAKRLAEGESALAEKEKELAELLEKVRRWDTANEKIKMMVKKDYYVDDMQTAKDELFKAENALRAAVAQ